MPEIEASLRALVRERAEGRCEYCQVPGNVTLVEHEIDHIIAVKHGGLATPENLALCCTVCNKHKGTDIASLDPATGSIVSLFHPRKQRWADHFLMREAEIVPQTPEGRVTVRLLQLNRSARLKERKIMMRARILHE